MVFFLKDKERLFYDVLCVAMAMDEDEDEEQEEEEGEYEKELVEDEFVEEDSDFDDEEDDTYVKEAPKRKSMLRLTILIQYIYTHILLRRKNRN
jgi:hypothetical protein